MEEFSVGIEAINFYGGPAYIDVKELLSTVIWIWHVSAIF